MIDLDELILRCVDSLARERLREAVLCYRAGAIRSAIISTWLSVVYHTHWLLVEMAPSVAAAQIPLTEWDRLTRAKDLPGLLQFESSIPALLEEMGIISRLSRTNGRKIATGVS